MKIKTFTGKSIELNKLDKILYFDSIKGELTGFVQSTEIHDYQGIEFIYVSKEKEDIDNATVVLIGNIIDKIIEAIKPTLKEILIAFIKKLLKIE